MFHKKQPDLNWENKEVREEIYAMINRWMKRGLAGFRVDAIINIKKALPFTSYEADREDGMCSPGIMLVHAKGVGDFLSEMKRECFEPYDAFTVGEVFDAKEDEIGDFIGDKGYFSSIFDFSTTLIGHSPKGWYDNKKPSAKEYINAVFNAQATIGDVGFISNIIENHDEPRGVSRYLPEGECTLKGKKMLALISFMVRGIPFIYQGQEIGMENCAFTGVEQFNDISTLDEYRVALEAGLSEEEALKAVSYYSRDNARTPMQWSDRENAGFSSVSPWMILNPKYKEINVEASLKDKNSVYHFYKELAVFRKSKEYKDIITYGDLERVDCKDENVMAFIRRYEDRTLLILANFQNKDIGISADYEAKEVLINNDAEFAYKDGEIRLTPYQALVLEAEKKG